MSGVAESDLAYEEGVARSPYSRHSWLAYIKAKTERDDPTEDIYILFERACAARPGDYKIWKKYLKYRLDRSKMLDQRLELNKVFTRAMATMGKFPRIWEMYLKLQLRNGDVTGTRRKFNECINSLPITQHHLVWKFALELSSKSYCPPNTAKGLFKRFLTLQPTQIDPVVKRYIKCGETQAAVDVLITALDRPDFVPGKDRTLHSYWVELTTLVTESRDVLLPPARVTGIIRSGISKFTDEVGALWVALANYHVRHGRFESARGVFEEGMATVGTLHDFEVIFKAYSGLMERLVDLRLQSTETEGPSAVLDGGDGAALALRIARQMAATAILEDEEAEEAAEGGEPMGKRELMMEENSAAAAAADPTAQIEEYKSQDLNLKMAQYEDLLQRREILENAVRIRQNPTNVPARLSGLRIREKKVLLLREVAAKHPESPTVSLTRSPPPASAPPSLLAAINSGPKSSIKAAIMSKRGNKELKKMISGGGGATDEMDEEAKIEKELKEKKAAEELQEQVEEHYLMEMPAAAVLEATRVALEGAFGAFKETVKILCPGCPDPDSGVEGSDLEAVARKQSVAARGAHRVWIEHSRFLENIGRVSEARRVLNTATAVYFPNLGDLVQVWIELVMLELRDRTPEEVAGDNRKAACNALTLALSGAHKMYLHPPRKGEVLPPQRKLSWSTQLWVALVHCTPVDARGDVYAKMLKYGASTPLLVAEHGEYLWGRAHYEEAFRTYEKAVTAFGWPAADVVWKKYVARLLQRVGGSDPHRVRSTFESLLGSFPKVGSIGKKGKAQATAKDGAGTGDFLALFAKTHAQYHLLYAKWEEKHGLINNAVDIYRRAVESCHPSEKLRLYRFYIARVVKLHDRKTASVVYEDAMKELNALERDEDVLALSVDFHRSELKLNEVTRARQVLSFASQFANPETRPSFWKEWFDFELKYGNEDTHTDMLRTKRTVAASYAMGSNFDDNALVAAKEAAKAGAASQDQLAVLQRNARLLKNTKHDPNDKTKKTSSAMDAPVAKMAPSGGVRFVRESGASATTGATAGDGEDDNELSLDGPIRGVLAGPPAGSQTPAGALARFKAASSV